MNAVVFHSFFRAGLGTGFLHGYLFYSMLVFIKKVIPLLRNPIFYDEKNNLIYPVDFMLVDSRFGPAFHGEIT